MRGGHIARAAAALLVCGCSAQPEVEIGTAGFALDAYCEATVQGTGTVDVETDYLARVVNCENGNADFEALKVQAVSARSYLYYKLDSSGSIGDGTGDQVFSCGREPRQEHYDAVAETSGIVLRYMDTQVAAFYVAGALQDGPSCRGGTNDPTGTEQWVTYNEGKSGDDIEQTPLGFVSPNNYANRGCMSQNGSDCLSMTGRDYQSILRFYYGEDIELVQSEGPCVMAVGGGDAGAGGVGPDAGDGEFMSGDLEGGGGLVGGCNGSGPSGWLGVLLVLGALGVRKQALDG